MPPPIMTEATSMPARAEWPAFDWLRFVLASTVVLGHAHIITWNPAGFLAVQGFFALSGWLIAGILLRTPNSDLPRFFFNRGTRIWIPYALSVALLYGVSLLKLAPSPRWAAFLFCDLTFTHNLYMLKPDPATALALMPLNGTGYHFWSISVEEQFYLALPLLFLIGPLRRSILFWLLLSAFFTITVQWFGAIMFGVAAAIARHRFGDWHLGNRAPVGLWTALLAFVPVLAFTTDPIQMARLAPPFAILLVLALAVPGQRTATAELFGGLSFPLYLNHWAAVFAVNAIARRMGYPETLATAFAGYAVAVGLCAAHYLCIDRPILRHRGRFYTSGLGYGIRGTAYATFLAGIAVNAWLWGWPNLR